MDKEFLMISITKLGMFVTKGLIVLCPHFCPVIQACTTVHKTVPVIPVEVRHRSHCDSQSLGQLNLFMP